MEFHEYPAVGFASEIAGYAPAKMKRKDLEDVYDEFSEFSLSSPARKIRRLDTELPPIMEEEEPTAPLLFGQPLPEEQLQCFSQQLTTGSTDAKPSLPSNEERAIVLYKPVNVPLLDSPYPSNVFLNVDPDVVASFKNQLFWWGQPKLVKTREEEVEASSGNGQAAVSSCLAVVPWIPSQLLKPVNAEANVPRAKEMLAEEVMASEDTDEASMDIELEGGLENGATARGTAVSEGLQHRQQHCMTPQAGPGKSTPVMWSWG